MSIAVMSAETARCAITASASAPTVRSIARRARGRSGPMPVPEFRDARPWKRRAVALLLSGLCLSGAAAAKDDFAGVTITFVMGSPPGGGYDSYVRPLVQHMARHLPGMPAMIVQSMPG